MSKQLCPQCNSEFEYDDRSRAKEIIIRETQEKRSVCSQECFWKWYEKLNGIYK